MNTNAFDERKRFVETKKNKVEDNLSVEERLQRVLMINKRIPQTEIFLKCEDFLPLSPCRASILSSRKQQYEI